MCAQSSVTCYNLSWCCVLRVVLRGKTKFSSSRNKSNNLICDCGIWIFKIANWAVFGLFVQGQNLVFSRNSWRLHRKKKQSENMKKSGAVAVNIDGGAACQNRQCLPPRDNAEAWWKRRNSHGQISGHLPLLQRRPPLIKSSHRTNNCSDYPSSQTWRRSHESHRPRHKDSAGRTARHAQRQAFAPPRAGARISLSRQRLLWHMRS